MWVLGRGHQPPVGTGTPRGSEAPPELALGPVAAPCLAAPSRSYYFRKQLWGQAAATPRAWVFLEDTEPPAAWLGALGAETPPWGGFLSPVLCQNGVKVLSCGEGKPYTTSPYSPVVFIALLLLAKNPKRGPGPRWAHGGGGC